MDVINSKEDEPQVIPETQNIVSPLLISDPEGTGDDESTQSPEDSVKNTPERTTSTNQSSKRDDIEFSQHAEGAPVTKKDPHQSKSTKSLSKMVQEVPIKPAQVTEIIDDDDDDDSDSKWSDAKKKKGGRASRPPAAAISKHQTSPDADAFEAWKTPKQQQAQVTQYMGATRRASTVESCPVCHHQFGSNFSESMAEEHINKCLDRQSGETDPTEPRDTKGTRKRKNSMDDFVVPDEGPKGDDDSEGHPGDNDDEDGGKKRKRPPQSARPPLSKMRARLQGAERQGEVLREAAAVVDGRREAERRMTSRPHLRAEASHLIGAQENLMTSLPRDQTTCLASQPRPLLFPFTWCATRCRLTSKDFRVFFFFFFVSKRSQLVGLVWVHSRNTRWGPPALVSCVTTNLFPTTRYHSRSTFVRSARGPTMRRMLTWTA